jgi:ADP-ribose pyrophosphatase YjhB (NUDIX family)
MKLRYSLLVVAPVPEDDPTDLPAATCKNLIALCRSKGVLVAVGNGKKRLPALGRGGPRIVFIAGELSPNQLMSIVQRVHNRGMKPVVVVDAIKVESMKVLHSELAVLNEKSFQLAHAGEIPSLLGLNWNDLHMHRFAKADNTSSVAVFLEGGKKILAIKRKHNPDAGKWALPGGFLNCQLETVEECGAREVGEETKVPVSPFELVLIDVRSSPRRDSRQHVVDHGYAWFVPPEREAEVYANMHAEDDADGLEVLDTEWLLQQDIAFDHRLIIQRALAQRVW